MAKSFNTKLVGVSHKNSDGIERQLWIGRYAKPGVTIHLKPEPDNAYDPNAVGAWITARTLIFFKADVQIGYLDARLAGEVSRLLSRGGSASARVVEVVGGKRGAETLGVVVEITKEEP
ncbi:MAG: HIRAN domain-containing protein [Rhodocyclaceae bacterium]|nr:HIRAN domain-containing protein [Rhodocyclaceae bacterium]